MNDTLITAALCGIILMLIAFSPRAKAGALDGIRLCESVIIPSLLPILILCGVLNRSRSLTVFERLFGACFEKCFALPRCTAAAVILGLTGGYPAGALLTERLYADGLIDSKTAVRMLRFNFCGGAAFIITAVGTVTYGSTRIGVTLYAVNVLSCVMMMVITRFFKDHTAFPITRQRKLPGFAESLPLAVEQTVKSLAAMSATIVLFSAFIGMLRPPACLLPFLEITNGVCRAEQLLSLPYGAFFLSFGGVCIHFQLAGILRRIGMKYWDFLAARTACALLSSALMQGCLSVFPDSCAVFSNLAAPQPAASVNGTSLSVLMVIGCAVVIFDLENRKIKLHS